MKYEWKLSFELVLVHFSIQYQSLTKYWAFWNKSGYIYEIKVYPVLQYTTMTFQIFHNIIEYTFF